MKTLKIIIFIMFITMISACLSKSPNMTTQNNVNKIKAKTIAVLPFESQDADNKTAQLLRSRLLEELYFKGYTRLPLETIDKKLESLNPNSNKAIAIAPQALKETLGVDAGMYCKLTEENKAKVFYAPINISLICELRSSESGEIVWNARSESVRRNFDFTDKGLEKKKRDDFEGVIDEVVTKIIKTLPEGPNLIN